MKIHRVILEEHPDRIKSIMKHAKKLGLDKIDYEASYSLVKTGVKNASLLGYPDEFTVCRGGLISLLGKDKDVWLAIETFKDWFKTSPIVSCTKEGKDYKIETLNSYYWLRYNYK